jgi:hypothetical protein
VSVSAAELAREFPSLAGVGSVGELQAWLDQGGTGEAATHAIAFVLEACGEAVEFEAAEAMHVWDRAHRDAYVRCAQRLGLVRATREA